jgi:hypothetical protein
MASKPSVPRASDGAGYDDQNNNGYRNGDYGGEGGVAEPTCDAAKHGKTKGKCTLEVFQMQQPKQINKIYGLI